jgi:hypothetical protein
MYLQAECSTPGTGRRAALRRHDRHEVRGRQA